MRSIAKGALVALLTGTILVTVGGTSASADEGRGSGKSKGTTSTKSANSDCGEYCSTRDGSPSRNGNGDGKATGRPCAGCVGKADNKNPHGQRPNGSDSNNGYECDGNKGIGKGNPAHTGCTATTPPAAPAPIAPAVSPVVVTPAAPVVTPVAPAVLGVKFVAPAAHGAEVAAESIDRAGVPAGTDVAPQVLGTRFERAGSGPSALPRTGSTTILLLVGAFALIVTGAVATRLGSSER